MLRARPLLPVCAQRTQHKHTHYTHRYLGESVGNNALPGIMALGYIAAFSETLALAVIAEKVRRARAHLLTVRKRSALLQCVVQLGALTHSMRTCAACTYCT